MERRDKGIKNFKLFGLFNIFDITIFLIILIVLFYFLRPYIFKKRYHIKIIQ